MNIALISDYLDTYAGRDKFLRTLSYMAKLATVATTNKEAEVKCKIVSSQLSGCRVILRLLDDIPMLHYAMSYEWGRREPDRLIRWVELLQIAVDIVFNPVEHICWAGEHKIVKINTESWDNATTWFWIVSLHLSLIKSLRKINKSGIHMKKKISKNTKSFKNGLPVATWNELITCTRLILDISYAVSYLPPGVLWGGRFKTWHVGALGTVSSLIGLYQALSKQAKSK